MKTESIGWKDRRSRYRRLAVLFAVVAALGIAACGGDDDDDGNDGDTTAASTATSTGGGGGGGGETVSIGETEFALNPSEVSVQAGEVTFDVSNDGGTVHNLEIEGPGTEASTDDLDPGQSGQVKVDLSKPGSYEMYCSIDGHRDLGMEGTITVK